MQKYLSNLEVRICLTVASLLFLKSMHSIYLEGFSTFLPIKTISATLPWISDIKNYDFAWESILDYLKINIVVYIGYFIVMEVTRMLHLRLDISSIIFSISFVYNYFGILVVNVTVINCIATYFITKYTKWDRIIWLWAIISILVLRLPGTFSILISHTGDSRRAYSLLMMLSWNVLRCVSFSVEKNNQHSNEHRMGLLQMLSYILYFPTIVTGPIINFPKFEIRHNNNLPSWKRYVMLIIEITRCFYAFMIVEVMQHLFFVADPIDFPNVSPLNLFYLKFYNKPLISF